MSQPLAPEHLVARPRCVLTDADDLEHLATLKEFPVSMYCVPSEFEKVEWHTDMEWCISKSTGCIQLKQLIDLNILYDDQHESGAIGGTWLKHHQEFCEFVDSFGVRTALEIGGGHGHLAKFYTEKNPSSTWMMVEPNMPDWLKGETEYPQILPIEGWFDESFQLPEHAPTDIDAIVHSHTFEHMYDYHGFLRAVLAHRPKYHIFSVPYQEAWMRNAWQNCIMFEHPQLLTPASIEYLMGCHGFVLDSKKTFGNEHSLFYAFRLQDEPAAIPAPPAEYEANKTLFQNWHSVSKVYVDDVNQKTARHPNQEAIYVFGAHIFTQYLVGFGLKVDSLAGILDNAQSKQGKRLYGLPLMVQSPQILKDVEGPAVVLRAGAYQEEIKRGILEINPSTVFWE